MLPLLIPFDRGSAVAEAVVDVAGRGRAGGVICAALLTTATKFKNAEGVSLAELEEPVLGASTGITDAAQALAEAWTDRLVTTLQPLRTLGNCSVDRHC